MQKKMKRIIISIILVFSFMSITANAALTFDNNSWYILVSNSATSSTAWTQILQLPENIVVKSGQSAPSTSSPHDFYVLFQANHIITADDIIVIQVALQGLDTINISGVGTITSSNYLPPKSIYEPNIKTTLIPNQTIIATTITDIGYDTKRITITFRAGTFSNNYVFAKFSNLTRAGVSVTLTEIDLFDSVEDAAGSGTTPEEMREVLDAWAEETLLPGMEESVQNGVTSGMEAALEDEKQQASSGAQGGLDELAGALSGVTEDITQAKQSFETLGSALSYSGTSASLTFPAMTVPFLGTISEAQPINLTEQIDNIMPPTLLLIIRCALSIGIVSYPIFELITQLRKLLDKG